MFRNAHDQQIPKLSLGVKFGPEFLEKTRETSCCKLNGGYCIFSNIKCTGLFVLKLLQNCRKEFQLLGLMGLLPVEGRVSLIFMGQWRHQVPVVYDDDKEETSADSVRLGCWSDTVKISWLTSLILGNWKIFQIEKYFLSDILRLQDGSSGRDEKESR